jgi:hypothetical protein
MFKIAQEVLIKGWRLNVGDALSSGVLHAAELYKRKVVTDQLCPMCGSEAESVSHALWSCG